MKRGTSYFLEGSDISIIVTIITNPVYFKNFMEMLGISLYKLTTGKISEEKFRQILIELAEKNPNFRSHEKQMLQLFIDSILCKE
mgnify:CR=1 FL=1